MCDQTYSFVLTLLSMTQALITVIKHSCTQFFKNYNISLNYLTDLKACVNIL